MTVQDVEQIVMASTCGVVSADVRFVEPGKVQVRVCLSEAAPPLAMDSIRECLTLAKPVNVMFIVEQEQQERQP